MRREPRAARRTRAPKFSLQPAPAKARDGIHFFSDFGGVYGTARCACRLDSRFRRDDGGRVQVAFDDAADRTLKAAEVAVQRGTEIEVLRYAA